MSEPDWAADPGTLQKFADHLIDGGRKDMRQYANVFARKLLQIMRLVSIRRANRTSR
jgi:hypothetical protein